MDEFGLRLFPIEYNDVGRAFEGLQSCIVILVGVRTSYTCALCIAQMTSTMMCAHNFFFLFLHFIFTKMELLTHEAKIKGKHLASLELFLQSSIKIPLPGKKCLQLLYNSWTLISDLTAKLSSWCSSRPQACTSCETISVVEVLVDLVVVLQVLESLERLFGFSTMKRCFDLLGISLAMDFEMKSEELSFLKLKHNSSSRHGRLLTTLKIILILNWSIQFSGWIPAVSVQSDPLYCKHMHSISSADQRAQVHHHRKKIKGSVYISMHING